MKFNRGDRVEITSASGSCLNGVSGVVESPTKMLGASAWYVKFDKPVTYPSGNIVERDVVFEHEMQGGA